ncbi:hypothetical protein FACS1894181_05760 [Bacteroidia bacterium]|nr:hypothetical protein FACS1894181_05760 [Bacteroidia bacterium]
MNALNTNITFFMSRLYQNEHVKAHEDVLNDIKTDVESISEVKEVLDDYEAGVERVKQIFRHGPKSPGTRKIAKLDKRRDKLWGGGKRLVKLYMGSAGADTCEAANSLLFLMNTYGDVPHFSLYGETGSLQHAIADFRKPENQAKAVLVPGFSAIIDELEAVNNELDTLYQARLEKAETDKMLGTLATNLPALDKQLIGLFHALNTVYYYNQMTAKDPAVKATIERIAWNVEALFLQLQTILAHRSVKVAVVKFGLPGPGGFRKPDTNTPPPSNE